MEKGKAVIAVGSKAFEIEPMTQLHVIEAKAQCPKCSKTNDIYIKFVPNPQIDTDFKKRGFKAFPKSGKMLCRCGFEIDLTGLKNQIEMEAGRKIIVS